MRFGHRFESRYNLADPSASSLITNLVSWWKLDELSGTRADSVGSNTLTDNNTVLAGGGVGSYALALNGTSQYLSVADPFAPPAKLSIVSWVYPTSVAAGAKIVLVQGRTGASNLSYGLYVNTATPTFDLSTDGTTVFSDASAAIGANAWSMISGVWDGANITAYTNATGSGSPTAFAGPLFNSTAVMQIGASPTPSLYFPGRIGPTLIAFDELTAADITELYNAGRALRLEQLSAALRAKLDYFWPLSEASGNRTDSISALALAPTNAPGRAAGIVNSSKTNTGANFITGNSEYLSNLGTPALAGGDTDYTWAVWASVTPAVADRAILTVLDITGPPTEWRDHRLGVEGTGAGSNYYFTTFYDNAGVTAVAGVVTSTVAAAATQWDLVIAWREASTNKIYISVNNETPVEATETNTAEAPPVPALYVGRYVSGLNNYLTGAIEELGRWNRILTAAERTYLYNSGAGRTYSGGLIL